MNTFLDEQDQIIQKYMSSDGYEMEQLLETHTKIIENYNDEGVDYSEEYGSDYTFINELLETHEKYLDEVKFSDTDNFVNNHNTLIQYCLNEETRDPILDMLEKHEKMVQDYGCPCSGDDEDEDDDEYVNEDTYNKIVLNKKKNKLPFIDIDEEEKTIETDFDLLSDDLESIYTDSDNDDDDYEVLESNDWIKQKKVKEFEIDIKDIIGEEQDIDINETIDMNTKVEKEVYEIIIVTDKDNVSKNVITDNVKKIININELF
jgi:hypothetical protein